MAKEKIKATKNPRLDVENIEGYPVISKAKYNEIIIKGEYLYGFKRYELNEVLIYFQNIKIHKIRRIIYFDSY